MIKRITFLIIITLSLVSKAQEKVLLRLNYKKGDRYETYMKMNQDLGEAVMKMEMKMNMLVEGVTSDNKSYDTKNQFTYLGTIITNKGKEEVNYNSDMKEEDLSDDAKKFRKDMATLLATKIFINVDKRGKSVLTKLEPEQVKDIEQLTNQFQSVVYPEKAVSVGSSWKSTQNSNGIEIEITYTIKEITDTLVKAELFGKIPLLPGARIEGDLEIDKKTGVALKSSFKMKADNPVMRLNNSTFVTIRKLN
ncbi:DUF6263 family protein [uncultured Tenacibaculum sp.]|uniref:DUF6263 family protein n=1 Tax=uncultured Tenacibaculum sp. TaxID=174713 RepID=UPI002627A72A|nr:DUF6263 family protein [uncultured Tenacibaculum sp.]